MRTVIAFLACLSLAIATAQAQTADHRQTLVRFDAGTIAGITRQDSQILATQDGNQPALQVTTGHKAPWPGITITAPDGHWDLSSCANVRFAVQNGGTEKVTINCRVDSPGGDGSKNSITGHLELLPGASRIMTVPLQRPLPPALTDKLYGMRGYPGGMTKEKGIDPARITQLIIFINHPAQDHVFRLGTIEATGNQPVISWWDMPADKFFPMIDTLGQFQHARWPGKVTVESELQSDVAREQQELTQHPGPADWNQYGGWKTGPQLPATGFFYATQHAGKWWLVDPEGCLFWSHGVDCVGFSGGTTPVTDREFYFTDLPEESASLARFYGRAAWAPHGYYQDKGSYRTFNFTAANLARKYGEPWKQRATETVHQRLRSWSLNSIGNWSDADIYRQHKTPYVVATSSGGSKVIEGSEGYWGKFPDPFDPSFAQALARQLGAQRDRTAGDPWCIGYFVDNELAWGDDVSLATAALASPADQPCKVAFLDELQQKYGDIQKLNAVWKTDHASWQALAECRTPPDKKQAADDLGAFYTRIAEEYFRQCRAAVKEVAPNNLYLGCRFAWVNDRGARAAARYCDVIGYNLYRDDVSDFQLPAGVDMPVIIGEFHFGALDRGMFHTGLRSTANQQARADAYYNYVAGALRNPCFVGSHWFQYGDQATTGRGDGENYQIGLVTICDRPYPETIAAVRKIGHSMYRLRYGDRSASDK